MTTAAAPLGACRGCGHQRRLRPDALIARHQRIADPDKPRLPLIPCPGSGKPPKTPTETP